MYSYFKSPCIFYKNKIRNISKDYHTILINDNAYGKCDVAYFTAKKKILLL